MARATKDITPKTTLDAAFAAYQAGNMVLARKLATQVLGNEPTAQDVEAAKRVGREVMVDRNAESDAKAVASELLARIRPYPKAYAFAGIAAAVWLLLVVFASTRGF